MPGEPAGGTGRTASLSAPASCAASWSILPVHAVPPNAAPALPADERLKLSPETTSDLDALTRIDPPKGASSSSASSAVSPTTVMRDWPLAKLWLMRELSAQAPHPPEPSDTPL